MIEITVERNAGHPWSGRSGFDRLCLEATTADELTAACTRAQEKFWQVWIRGLRGAVPAAVLYKPCDARVAWHDSPDAPHPGNL